MAPGCIYWSLPRGEVPSDGSAWGKEKVQERVSQISLSLGARLCALPAASCPAAFALSRGTCWPPPAALPGQQSVGEPRCCQNRGREPGARGDRPKEIWGVIEERETGGGDSFSLSSLGLHHFLIRHKIVFIHWYCCLHKHHHYGP